jgi:hypothetical protein
MDGELSHFIDEFPGVLDAVDYKLPAPEFLGIIGMHFPDDVIEQIGSQGKINFQHTAVVE